MATALQGLRLSARSCSCRFAQPSRIRSSIGSTKTLSTTSRWKQSKQDRQHLSGAHEKIKSSTTSAARRAVQSEQALEEIGELQGIIGDDFDEMLEERINPRYPPYHLPPPGRPKKDSFLNLGEDEPWETEDVMDEGEDDITTLGHGELERHREIRHYARLIAWEMPMLSKLAKPFVPPSTNMPLRFRYTSYMGEQHPAEKKVVVEFATADIPDLTDVQREKIKKLVGVRYNPMTGIVKMSCEMYETQAQNKRYLGNVIDSLLVEARDPTDTFEDVPLDTRHHYYTPSPRFPKKWVMTDERRSDVDQYRHKLAARDRQLELAGRLVDGIRRVEEGLKQPVQVGANTSTMAMAGQGKGAPKRLAVRR